MTSPTGVFTPRCWTTDYALSAVTGNAFPQLLTSLSMAKERYCQSPRVLAYRCQQKLGGFMLLPSPALPPGTDSCIYL